MNHDISYYLTLLRRAKYWRYKSRQAHGLLDKPKRAYKRFNGDDYDGVCLHWLGTSGPTLLSTTAQSEEYLEGVQEYHMGFKGWNDIAYNFAVSQQGRIYECRGIDAVGGAQYGFNQRFISVLCLIGDETESPTRAMKTSLRHLIGAIAYKFSNEYNEDTYLLGHKELNPYLPKHRYKTTCPGPRIMKWIERQKQWRT